MPTCSWLLSGERQGELLGASQSLACASILLPGHSGTFTLILTAHSMWGTGHSIKADLFRVRV